MRKKIICLVITACLVLSLAAPAAAVYVDGKNVYGQGLFVMDYETGTELYSYNADTLFVPASITKLMSMYLTYEAVKNGEISMDTEVPISKNVYRLSRDASYWNTVPLYYDQTYLVSELMELILIYSASASVVAIAELICGSEAAFVDRMNAKAAEWGIDAGFVGCSGIQDNHITPRAVAELSRRLISDYPEVLNITSRRSLSFHGRTYSNTNHLLSSHYYEGVDGLKSGTTTNAGNCFVATCSKNGVRIITVVMKSATKNSRFTDSKILLDYGFSVRDSAVREATMKLAPFTDVYTDDWFAGAVSAVNAGGLMTGTTGTTFSPNQGLNRAMAVVLLHRLAGSPQSDITIDFSDVGEHDWFRPALSWALEHEIVSGEGESFSPYQPVSRQELVWMIFNYAKARGLIKDVPPLPENFTDRDAIAPWAQEAVAWAVDNELIRGISSALLDPGSYINRAQTAAVIVRLTAWLSTANSVNSEPEGQYSEDTPPAEPSDSPATEPPEMPEIPQTQPEAQMLLVS